MLTPTGCVTNGPKDTLPTGQGTRQALGERANRQRWRAVSGPSPGAPNVEVAITGKPLEGGKDGVATATDGDPRALPDTTREWLAGRDKHWQILNDRDFVKGQAADPSTPAPVSVQDPGRDWRRPPDEAPVPARRRT